MGGRILENKQTGGCLCKDIRFQFDRADVLSAHHCHCEDCQRSSGCGFTTFCIVPESAFRLTSGATRSYTVKGATGGEVNRHFCANCGSPIFSRVDMAPDVLFVKVGTLDDPSWIEPESSFWVESAQPWAQPAAGIPANEGNPA